MLPLWGAFTCLAPGPAGGLRVNLPDTIADLDRYHQVPPPYRRRRAPSNALSCYWDSLFTIIEPATDSSASRDTRQAGRDETARGGVIFRAIRPVAGGLEVVDLLRTKKEKERICSFPFHYIIHRAGGLAASPPACRIIAVRGKSSTEKE